MNKYEETHKYQPGFFYEGFPYNGLITTSGIIKILCKASCLWNSRHYLKTVIKPRLLKINIKYYITYIKWQRCSCIDFVLR